MLAKNCIEYPLIYLAASRAGVVPVPLNYRSAPTEWEYVIHDSVARLVLVAGPYLDVGGCHQRRSSGTSTTSWHWGRSSRRPAGPALDAWIDEQQ